VGNDLGMGAEPRLLLVTGPPDTGKSTVAEAGAERLGASVFAWDWVMAGLTPFDEIQSALRGLDLVSFRRVGWSRRPCPSRQRSFCEDATAQ
jgi:hypothetical protein